MTVVEVNCGKIKGYTENNLQIFKGIPYAEPPIGDLRFSPPQAKNLGMVCWTLQNLDLVHFKDIPHWKTLLENFNLKVKIV